MNALKRYTIDIDQFGQPYPVGEKLGYYVLHSEAAALLADKDKEIARLRVEKDRITKKLGMVQSQFAMKEEALIRDYVKSQIRKQHDIDLLSEKDAEIEKKGVEILQLKNGVQAYILSRVEKDNNTLTTEQEKYRLDIVCGIALEKLRNMARIDCYGRQSSK